MTTLATNCVTGFFGGVLVRDQAKVINGKLHVVYCGANEDIYIIRCDVDGSNIEGPYLVGTNPLPNDDAHGIPALWVDGQGRLNVFGACHNTPMKHWRAPSPGVVDSWQAQPDFVPQATYPCIQQYSGEWATWAKMIYRGSGGWFYRYTADNGVTWSVPGTLAQHGAGGDSFYYTMIVGPDGSDHYCGCWCDKNYTRGSVHPYHLHDFFYYRIPPTGGYVKTDGTPLPTNFIASPTNYASTVRVLDTGATAVQIPVMELDAAGNPHVLLTIGTPAECEVRYGRIVNGAWVWETICTCGHVWYAGSLLLQGDTIVALIPRGTNDPAHSDARLERWDRIGGQWQYVATVLEAESPLYWNSPVRVQGADAFVIGEQPTGRVELITIGSTPPPPPPPPPPVETWKRTGSLNEALAAGSPVRAVNGVVESTHGTWT